MIYVTGKNHYINMSWGQNFGFKTFKLILDEEQREKIYGSRDIINEELTSLFHPCQLEKKYGGTAESPTNYWPPFVGEEFQPPDSQEQPKFLSDDEYVSVIEQNPDLPVHPLFLPANDDSSRDFINPQSNFTENIADATATVVNAEGDQRSEEQLSVAAGDDDALSADGLERL